MGKDQCDPDASLPEKVQQEPQKVLGGGELGDWTLCLVLLGRRSRSSPGLGEGGLVPLLWGWGRLACTPTWTSRPLNGTAYCPCRSCQQSSHQVFPSSGHLPARLGAPPPQPRSLTAPQPSPASFLPRNGSAQGISHPVTIVSPSVSLGHLALLLNGLSCPHPTCSFHQTDNTPRGTKTHAISHPRVRAPLSVLSLALSSSPSFSRFFCFLLFFVRFVSFIPSKPPEQLTMSNYSGTFALFTFTSKTEDVG